VSRISEGPDLNPQMLACQGLRCCHDNYSRLAGFPRTSLIEYDAIQDSTRMYPRELGRKKEAIQAIQDSGKCLGILF
jgi:hypothetical protein